MSNYQQLLSNKNFRWLWLGQCIAALGDRFTQMSLLTIVMVLRQDNGEKMAWITFFSLLPFLLFGHLFGVVSDRANRKKIMIGADIIRAFLVGLIPFISWYAGSVSYLYAIVFCVGTLSALFSPAKMATIPHFVAKERLVGANSLIASTGMIATLVGTAIAGLLIRAIGPYPSFFVNAATFSLSALMLSQMEGFTKTREKTRSARSIVSDIKEGLRFINRHQLVFRIVQLNAVFSLISSFFYITILNYSTSVLGLSSAGYGLLLACLGFGLCSGALLLGKRIGTLNFNRILLTGFFLVGCMNYLFIMRPSFVYAVILLVIGGAGASLVMVTLDSLLQRSTPDSLRANVFGARGIITNAVFLASLLVVGKLLSIFGPLPLFCILGILSFIVATIIYLSLGSLGYRLVKGGLRLILRIFFQLQIKGLSNLPRHGKVILAGNHTSLLDGIIVMAAYPHQVYFLAADSVFKVRFVGYLARHLGFIPIKRGGFNKEAIREAVRILEARSSIGIFPEGRISPDGNVLSGKKGVAIIAQKTKTPVIPFAIEGAYDAWPLSRKRPRRYPLEISFGRPLDVRGYSEAEVLVEDVMEEIKKIKSEMEKENLLEVEPNVIVRHLLDFS